MEYIVVRINNSLFVFEKHDGTDGWVHSWARICDGKDTWEKAERKITDLGGNPDIDQIICEGTVVKF